MSDVATTHRSLYDAIETADIDLMRALWVDGPTTACAHPGHPPIHGTGAIIRSWTMVMAGASYLQFFLTDVHVAYALDGGLAVVTCTENILSGQGLESADSFAGGKVTSTSVLVRTGGRWRFHTRHAGPVIEFADDEDGEV